MWQQGARYGGRGISCPATGATNRWTTQRSSAPMARWRTSLGSGSFGCHLLREATIAAGVSVPEAEAPQGALEATGKGQRGSVAIAAAF